MHNLSDSYQNESLLSKKFEKLLSESKYQAELRELLSVNKKGEVGSLLCEILINYCSFSFDIENKKNPFDDPYVGAALITEKGNLLSSHRKIQHNERHAEASCICKAIKGITNPKVADLISSIDQAYKDKSWLESGTGRVSFLGLFKEAGNLLRQHVQSKYACDKLILISTLEPCLEFESQPACAHIISNLKPDLVLYGSDDTNEKGQGRQILNQNRIPTVPNLSICLNIDKNILFYSSIHYLQLLHTTEQNVPPSYSFQIYYIQVNLDASEIEHVIGRDDRMKLSFHSTFRIVRKANPEIRASKLNSSDLFKRIKCLEPNNNKVDSNKVLFVNYIDPIFITKYLMKCLQTTNSYPGIIISSCSLHDTAVKKALKQIQNKLKITVYTDFLRKSDERVLAGNYIKEWRITEDNNKLYVVFKFETGYESFCEDCDKLLVNYQINRDISPKRISVYFDSNNLASINIFLKQFQEALISSSKPIFKKTSLELIPVFFCTSCHCINRNKLACPSNCDAFNLFKIKFELILNDLNLLSRRNIKHLVIDLEHKAQELLSHVVYGSLDPILIPPETFHKIIKDLDWKQRQYAGMLLSKVIEQQPDLLDALIVKQLKRLCLDELRLNDHWMSFCSLLNALSNLDENVFNKNRVLIIDALLCLAKLINSNVQDNIDTNLILIDIVWRFTSVVFTRFNTLAEIRYLISGVESRIVQNEFLLKELFYYISQNKCIKRQLCGYAWEILSRSSIQNQIPLKNVLLRIVRIAATSDDIDQRMDAEQFNFYCKQLTQDSQYEIRDEKVRCVEIVKSTLSDVFKILPPNNYKALASYIYLHSTKYGSNVRGLRNEIESMFRNQLLLPTIQTKGELLSWRGDKTNFVKLILSEIPVSEIFNYLEVLAADEDETIQWVALAMAFDRGIRGLYVKYYTGEEYQKKVVAIIQTIFKKEPFYWLQREFLHQLYSEYFIKDGFSIPPEVWLDFPAISAIQDLLHNNPKIRLHPEVKEEQNQLLSRMNISKKEINL
jgi:pyrimidine deaminase RibD-like protein